MRNFAILLILLMLVMLFISNPVDESARLYQAVWNTGHLFLFAFLSWFVIKYTALHKYSGFKLLLLILLFSLLLGGAIELLQAVIGRYMEWQDLFTDLLGGILGFLAVQFFEPKQRRIVMKPVIVLLSVVVLMLAFYPVYKIFRDDLSIESNFPMIADFESEQTIQRWEFDHVRQVTMDSDVASHGQSSLKLEFGFGKYPAALLSVLYPDWSAYHFLNISVHNGQSERLELDIKVADRLHLKNGFKYSDRFNYEVMLEPGWNDITISLLDVLNAPKNRKMDLRNITMLSVFISNPQDYKVIHLDNIHLSR